MKSIYQKFLGLILLTPLTALADWGLNMTQGVTPISKEIYDMHMLTLWVVTIIGILVFGVMFWSIFHHRKSKGVKASKFSHSNSRNHMDNSSNCNNYCTSYSCNEITN